jgi:HipA-like protein
VSKLTEKFMLAFKTPPPRLLVTYKDIDVAELQREEGEYVFRYLPAFHEVNLAPIPSFPDLTRVYRSADLWQFFRERIPDLRRPEVRQVVQELGIPENDELQLLEKLGARSVTDPFQIRRVA